MTSEKDLNLCNYCEIGYHAPFERFERMATIRNSPTFLNRCKICRTLWHETLHDARIVSVAEAIKLFPSARSEDLP